MWDSDLIEWESGGIQKLFFSTPMPRVFNENSLPEKVSPNPYSFQECAKMGPPPEPKCPPATLKLARPPNPCTVAGLLLIHGDKGLLSYPPSFPCVLPLGDMYKTFPCSTELASSLSPTECLGLSPTPRSPDPYSPWA